MTKFDAILEKYADIIEELVAGQPQIDLTTLDTATGDQIQQGLAEILGSDPDQMNKVLQGLVNSKSVNPTAAGQVTNPDPVAAQQAATNAVANQGSKATQTNPVAGAERRAVTNVG